MVRVPYPNERAWYGANDGHQNVYEEMHWRLGTTFTYYEAKRMGICMSVGQGVLRAVFSNISVGKTFQQQNAFPSRYCISRDIVLLLMRHEESDT